MDNCEDGLIIDGRSFHTEMLGYVHLEIDAIIRMSLIFQVYLYRMKCLTISNIQFCFNQEVTVPIVLKPNPT